MNQKSIIVRISTTGQVTVEAVGFTGQACEQATAAIVKALGEVNKVEEKPEWYRTEEQHIQL